MRAPRPSHSDRSPGPSGRARALLLAGILLLAAAGCDEAAPSAAEDERMIETLLELHLLDGRMAAAILEAPAPGLRDSVLAKFGFTEATFEEAMEAYVSEPEALVALYSAVLDRLTQERLP